MGEIFGLDIYGLDVVETSNGPVVLDINDFPSFGHVPEAVSRVSNYILHIAEHARLKRPRKAMIEVARQPLRHSADSWLDEGLHPNKGEVIA